MSSLRNRPIGIFDSGVGGLTVVKSVRKQLPNEDIIYFGDTARVPYGNKSRSTIIRFANEIMGFLVKNKVKAVVVACNTASSLSLPDLKRRYPMPIIGVIEPGVKAAIKNTKTKRVGVIGTESTIKSGAYDRELKKADKTCKLFAEKCPLFVPIVESRFDSDIIISQIARKYLRALKKNNVDTLILGCTHYPILKTIIKKVIGKATLVDSSRAVAEELEKMLLKKRLDTLDRGNGYLKCFVSDNVEGFRKTANIFLNEKISVKKVIL